MGYFRDPDWDAVAYLIFCVFALIGVITVAEKVLGLSKETSRKLVHIAVGHIVLGEVVLVRAMTAAAAPLALFVVLNAVSLRFNTFSTMELKTRARRADQVGIIIFSFQRSVLQQRHGLLSIKSCYIGRSIVGL
jgi:hypothetical protein